MSGISRKFVRVQQKAAYRMFCQNWRFEKARAESEIKRLKEIGSSESELAKIPRIGDCPPFAVWLDAVKKNRISESGAAKPKKSVELEEGDLSW